MADSKIPLSNLPKPAVPASQTFGQPGLQLDQLYISPATKAQLSLVGWEEGDPLPDKFGEFVKLVRQNYGDDPNPDPNRPKGGLFDIGILPPAARDELRAVLQEHKLSTKAKPKQVPGISAGPADVPATTVQESGGFIADSIELPKAAKAEPAAKPAALPAEADLAELEAARVEFAAKQSEEPPVTQPAGVQLPVVTHCPRCFWTLANPFPLEPTAEDTKNFVISITLGKCFEKEYLIFGGRAKLRMRGISAKEMDTIRTQLAIDVKENKILNNVEYMAALIDYRMFYMFRGITTLAESIAQTRTFPDVREFTGAPGTTPLPAYGEHFFSELAPSESIVRIARQLSHEFSALCEKLESAASEASFWTGIGR